MTLLKIKHLIIIVNTVFLLAACSNTVALREITVTGRVIDRYSNENKANMIVVLLIHSKNCLICKGGFREISRTSSNKEGFFKFDNLGIAEYALKTFVSKEQELKRAGFNHIGIIDPNKENNFKLYY